MERNDAADELWRGCGLGCWFWIVNGILAIVVAPLLKHLFGRYWLYALFAGFGALFLWGWWRQRRKHRAHNISDMSDADRGSDS